MTYDQMKKSFDDLRLKEETEHNNIIMEYQKIVNLRDNTPNQPP